MERRFGSTAPFTTAVEEEFQLIDPRTRELVPAVEAVVGAAPEGTERMGRELFQDCVELRVPDAQAEARYVVALVALIQCIVATAEAHAPQDARFVSENKWRAIRRGLDARLYDFDTGEERGARETARDLVAGLRPVSQDLSGVRGGAGRRARDPGPRHRRRAAADGLREAGIPR